MCDNSKREDLNLWIEDFLKKRGLCDQKYKLELVGNTAKGDGYLGDVTFVNVLVVTGNEREEEKLYNLVIKSAKKSDKLQKTTPIIEVFEREMFMYSQVFPAFKKLQVDHSIEEPFMKFPKCYSTFNENNKQALLLQNLKQLEFHIHDRKTTQNLDHVLHVFKNYAKFHAISLTMAKQQPEIYKSLTQNMSDLLYIFMVKVNMIVGLAKTFKEALELVKGKDEPTYKKLAHFDENCLKGIMCKDKNPPDGLAVILHGDCWNNNMMFTYRDASRKKPSDMRFLDFQLSSVGSPIYDLSYYLYAVADETVLKYHDLLLQTYHHSLISFLEELNDTSHNNVSLEDIKRHWAEYGKFGLVMAPFILKIELSEADEVVDIAESAEAGDMSEAFNVNIKNSDEYEARVRAVFKHFASFL